MKINMSSESDQEKTYYLWCQVKIKCFISLCFRRTLYVLPITAKIMPKQLKRHAQNFQVWQKSEHFYHHFSHIIFITMYCRVIFILFQAKQIHRVETKYGTLMHYFFTCVHWHAGVPQGNQRRDHSLIVQIFLFIITPCSVQRKQ